VFDSHRLAAYLELKQPERAIPMLEASERDFPQDYNPPARLAAAYRAMKEWDKALAAADPRCRAYARASCACWTSRPRVLKSKGDLAGARRVLGRRWPSRTPCRRAGRRRVARSGRAGLAARAGGTSLLTALPQRLAIGSPCSWWPGRSQRYYASPRATSYPPRGTCPS
jgi:hypothetical protein